MCETVSLHIYKSICESHQITSNLYCNYTFLIDLELNGIIFGTKSAEKSLLPLKFGLIYLNSGVVIFFIGLFLVTDMLTPPPQKCLY